MTGASAIYAGYVAHRRTRPRAHALRYRIFMLLLDLDELPGLFARLRLLRPGRFGPMSFNAADHGDRTGGDLTGGDRTGGDLKAYVAARLAEAGIAGGGPVRLLCMPRILGYGFNPLSLYFCHDQCGALAAILYEVRNTFGERHSYLVATPEGGDAPLRQGAPKQFFVSPFMDMDLTYAFTVAAPGEQVGVRIAVSDAEGPILTALFHGARAPLTDGQLLRAWLSHPLLSVKVMAGIHWEALKLLAKGLRLRRRPALPRQPVTLGHAS